MFRVGLVGVRNFAPGVWSPKIGGDLHESEEGKRKIRNNEINGLIRHKSPVIETGGIFNSRSVVGVC